MTGLGHHSPVHGYPVHGYTEPRFTTVRDEFADIVASSSGGCAFSVFSAGRVVVDLWGGVADQHTGAAWAQDTAVLLFSGTKGLTAVVLAHLMDRGLLDPDEAVARYWPDFAQAGKDTVLVRHLAAHTAGLPCPDLSSDDLESVLFDQPGNARQLAAQATRWPPGEVVVYHPLSFGVLLDEVVRGAVGVGVGEYFRREIAERFDLDIWLGCPEAVDDRVARLLRVAGYRTNTFASGTPEATALSRMYGFLTAPGEHLNSVRLRRMAHPAVSGVATARDMARLYDLIVSGSGTVPLLSSATLARVTREHAAGRDRLNGRPVVFGFGFELQDPLGSYGPVSVAFGHSGAGGGIHGAWPQYRLGFSFSTNELRPEDADGRAKRLLRALAGALSARPGG